MAELYARRGAALMHKVDDARKLRHKGVVPEAQVAYRTAATALDLGRFEDHQPRAAGRVATGVHQMPIGGRALYRGILVHGCDHHAVLQREFAQAQRREKQGLGHDSS